MTRAVDTSHQIAGLTLRALIDHGLPATPRNYEVWFAHLEGKNPALSRDIQKCSGPDGEITQAQADGLYDLHIRRTDLSLDVMEVVSRFEAELVELANVISASGENAQGHGEQLQRLSTQLRQTADEHPNLGVVLESVLAVTKSVRQENLELEKRLAESSDEVASLRHSVEHIQQEAMTDPLTGVKNRKSFDLAIVKHMRRARELSEPLALIIGDVDHFKQFNDRWGHQTGDQVLRLVAEVMNANVKGQDLLARYGGEEFAILLPGTTLVNAEMLADRIRRAIESRRLKKRRTDEDLGLVTMSMGIAAYADGDTTEMLIERADECLYAAKRAGRNRVIRECGPDKPNAPRLRSTG
jgi:diguanylate cyclase